MIEIGIAGKPNCGKSTFFKAATLADAEIASYPFTTVKPNVGIGYVKVKCVCSSLNVKCENCTDGWRFIPIKLIDIAGLVPEAHKGRGLGNEFLDNLRRSEGIIHVIDVSGSTDEEGNEIEIGHRNPIDDIKFLNYELDMWIFGILKRNWNKILKRSLIERVDLSKFLYTQLAGLGFKEWQIKDALSKIHKSPKDFDEKDLIRFSSELRKKRMKMIIAANKADKAPKELIEKVLKFNKNIILTSALFELTLRTAAKNGYIYYIPGERDFKILKQLNKKQEKALNIIKNYLRRFGNTGVQEVINKIVFDVLDYVVVYPVEDENKYTDSSGNVLPDAFLVKKGTTAKELAYMIHTEIGENFIYAVDARRKMRIPENYEIKNGDVIKIVSAA